MTNSLQLSKYLAAAVLGAGLATASVLGATGFQAAAVAPAPAQAPVDTCGGGAAAQLRTTLYFGTTRAGTIGAVSELEWQLFIRDEVTTRFPDGLTAWEALGQWRDGKGTITQERAKVLLIVHADSEKARALILDVISRYRKMFDQESVLWETARVCVTS